MPRKQQPQQAAPLSFTQARQRRQRRQQRQRRPGKPGKPSGDTRSAAERLAARVVIQERTELTGRTDQYHAYRGGYGQGAIDALGALEILVNDDIDLDTALYELRAWLMGPDFHQWVNAPDDPTEIAPDHWLARRNSSSSPPSPPALPPAS